MEEYQELIHLAEIQSDSTDDYFSMDEEGNMTKLDIIHLFGKEKLENIQESLSKATGVAFVTVDFRGEPITDSTHFSSFCRQVRNSEEAIERCKSSDAFGSIQAAVTKKANVYFCPCGLLEMAIPIIVRGNYLGGFIGGQVQCFDAPESVSRLASVMRSAQSEEVREKSEELRKDIPVVPYEKFLDIANLVFLVINQLSENEVSKHLHEGALKSRIKKIQGANQLLVKEIAKKNMELQELKMNFNPCEMMEVMTSLMNLSIMEDTEQFQEFLGSFIEYTKYKCMEKGTFVPISKELDHAEKYFLIQSKKLGDRLNYSIQVPREMHMRKMPSGILLPFIQDALYNGIALKKQGGKISIGGSIRNNSLVLEITNDGPGLSEVELEAKYEMFKDKHEGYYIKLGKDYAREKMRRLFGEEYKIISESTRNKGGKSVLIWPEHYEERTE
ncbi:PocR ligand-binding domain-containing protein [Lacrimispora sp.]|uniref:PocR ligand-binding domain-containing protein n=1 Tax=Lacrimispora sp. TaxID=2719234 RepID=UPI003993897C